VEDDPVTARRVGVALAAGRGVCVAAASTQSFHFDADALAAGDGATLTATLRAARCAVASDNAGPVDLHVALCAPWTAPRELSLPPMRARDAHAVLTRDHARHFPVARPEPVVALQPLRQGAWIAADADSAVLDAIARAATDAGYAATRIVPAAGAWASAAGAVTARAFVVDDECTMVSARQGRVTALRRRRAADAPTTEAAAEDALPLAARHAAVCTDLELVGRDVRARRLAGERRLTFRLLGAGVVALAVAAGVLPWGSSRRLADVEAARTVIQSAAQPVAARHDSLAAVQEARAAIRAARGTTPWSGRLAVLANALSNDAHFTMVRAAGDSAVVEGSAEDATAMLLRLRQATGVRSVRELPAAPSAGDARESFAAVVHFRGPGVR